jgi:uncharacterized membrane protein
MPNTVGIFSELGSLALAIGSWLFFNLAPGYEPGGQYGMLIGIAVVLAIAVVYGIMEVTTVVKGATPSPLYFAWETFASYTPLIALAMVLQRWFDGLITLSPFQWLAAGIILLVVLLDVFGFVTMLAQRYLLTDELKTVG